MSRSPNINNHDHDYRCPSPLSVYTDHSSEIDMLPEDVDELREVFLFIFGPRSADATARDLHWSIGWKVAPGVWRHIFLELYTSVDAGLTPVLRYVYPGAETVRATVAMREAQRCSLGRLSRRQRAQVEELAHRVGVCRPSVLWTCQEWIKGVLLAMVDEGVIPQRVREDAVEYAANAWKDAVQAWYQ